MALDLDLWRTRFREHLETLGTSPRTVDNYAGELRPFFEFLEGSGLEGLAGLTRDLVEEYRTHLFYAKSRGRSLALSTQRVRLQAVKRFVRFLARDSWLLLDVGSSVELPRAPRTLPRVILTEDEVARLMDAPDLAEPLGVRDRTILEVLYGTGIRNAECGSLALEDLDAGRKVLHVRHGKGARARVVPVGEEALAWLEEYLARVRPGLAPTPDPARLFLSCRGRALHRTDLAQMVARHARQAGLTKAVTPHVLRHSCATHMLRRGAGLRHLQVLLGHTSSDTTQRYTRVELSDLRGVLRRCHPRERRL